MANQNFIMDTNTPV